MCINASNICLTWYAMHTLWRHQMETFSALLDLMRGIHRWPVTTPHRPAAQSFDVSFDLRLNQQLSKQWRRRWFETSLHSSWRHCNAACYPLQTSHIMHMGDILWCFPIKCIKAHILCITNYPHFRTVVPRPRWCHADLNECSLTPTCLRRAFPEDYIPQCCDIEHMSYKTCRHII